MPIFRHIWNFSGQQGSPRWAEVHHQNIGAIDEAVVSIRPSIVDKRLSILAKNYKLDSISVLGVHPSSLGTDIEYGRSGTADFDATPANPGEAARFSLAGATGGRRFLWMRGLPEDAIKLNATAELVINPGFLRDLGTLVGLWAGAGYGVLTRTRRQRTDPVGLGYPNLITGVTYKAGGLTQLTLAAGSLVPVKGTEIVLGGFDRRSFYWASGTKLVVIADPLTIEQTGLPHDLLIDVTRGYYFTAAYTIRTYSTLNAIKCKMATRKTKNDNTGSRGARSALGGRVRR